MKESWTTDELAAAAGVTSDFVRQEIRAGRLAGIKRGRDWFIENDEAQRWLNKPTGRKRGPKPKAK